MPIKRYTAEQIIGMLRQAEIELAGGKTTGEVCGQVGYSPIHTLQKLCKRGGE